MSRPEWLPDWNDPNQYPPSTANPQQFAWEFLRRNRHYQWAYTWMSEVVDYEVSEGDVKYTATSWVGKKFHLVSVVDPALDSSRVVPAFDTKRTSWTTIALLQNLYRNFDLPPDPDDQHKVLLSFDLTQPIKPQLSEANRTLLEQQRARGRLHGHLQNPGTKQPSNRISDHSLLINYLRVLDAVACNVPVSELAEKLLPHIPNTYANEYGSSDRIKQWLIAATRFRDHDYIFIAAGNKGLPTTWGN